MLYMYIPVYEIVCYQLMFKSCYQPINGTMTVGRENFFIMLFMM